MTKNKTAKCAFLLSLVTLVACIALFAGAAFAWFSSTATNGGNKITAGTIKVDLELMDETSGQWSSVNNSSTPIFYETDFQPGDYAMRVLKVQNEGVVKFRWKTQISTQTALTELADVIDVFVKKFPTVADAAYGALDSTWTNAGTVRSFVANSATVLYGVLDASEEAAIGLTLKMRDSVDNRYLGMDLGGDIDIEIKATQMNAGTVSAGESAPVQIPASSTEDLRITTSDADDFALELTVPAAVLNSLAGSGVTSVALKHSAPEYDDAANTVTFSSVDLVDQDGEVIDLTANTTDLTVTLPVPTFDEGEQVAIYHDGVAVASAIVTDGVITYTVAHLCEISIGKVTEVATLSDLKLALANGGNISLKANLTTAQKLSIVKDTFIVGNGHTLTYTGNERIIDVPKETNGADLALSDLTISVASDYTERGINYNTSGTLTLDRVTLSSYAVTYAVNLPSSSNGARVEIKNSSIAGKIALNLWGSGVVINAYDTEFVSIDENTVEDYAAIKINSNGVDVAENSVINIYGGSVTATNENDAPSAAFTNKAFSSVINVADDVTVVGKTVEHEALVVYEGYNEFYACMTLQEAFDQAAESPIATVRLYKDITLTDETVTVAVGKTVKLDLNGYAINGSFTEAKTSHIISNKGTLVIDDNSTTGEGAIELVDCIVSDNDGYATDVIFNEGSLTINGGNFRNSFGGASYCVDNNVGGTTTINGGSFVNTVGSAIRAYSWSDSAESNLIVNGGEITGHYAIIAQNLSSSVAGKISVTITDGTLSSNDDEYNYAVYSYGTDGTNVIFNISGGVFNGSVMFTSGYYGKSETVTVTGGTFNGTWLGRYEDGEWVEIAKP